MIFVNLVLVKTTFPQNFAGYDQVIKLIFVVLILVPGSEALLSTYQYNKILGFLCRRHKVSP